MNICRSTVFSRLSAFFTLAILLTASACGSSTPPPPPPPKVVVQKITPKVLPYTGEYSGQTAGYKEVDVKAQVGGILLKRVYKEGDLVKENALLFQIDPKSYEAALAQAKGTIAQAKASVYQTKLDNSRMQTLYKEGAVSRKERDDAFAAYNSALGDLETAKGTLDNAKINLGYTNVLAPVAGSTSEENVSEGNLIVAGQSLTKIVQLDSLYINFAIPSTEYLQLRDMLQRGILVQPADNKFDIDIKLADGSIHSGSATLDFVDPKVDTSTSTIKARAIYSNVNSKILPGQFVRVFVKGYAFKDALAVPQRAVLNTGKGYVVYVLDKESKAQFRPIKVEMSLGNTYIVKEGLKPGETILTDGILRVQPGKPVTVVTPEAEKSAQETEKSAPEAN